MITIDYQLLFNLAVDFLLLTIDYQLLIWLLDFIMITIDYQLLF